MIPYRSRTHLIESIEQVRDQRRSRARCTKRVHETKFFQVADEAVRRVLAESQRVSPEIPLKCDDRARCHTRPDHAQCRLSPCKTRVEEAKTRYHDQHHGRGNDNVCLVTRLKPLVQVLDICVFVSLEFTVFVCPVRGGCIRYCPRALARDSIVVLMDVLESPPMSWLVPLKVEGAPTHEYDILAAVSRQIRYSSSRRYRGWLVV